MRVILIGGFVEIIELCESNDIAIYGIVDLKEESHKFNYPYLGTDKDVEKWKEASLDIPLLLSPDDPKLREKLFIYYKGRDFVFLTLLSNKANISKSAEFKNGVVVQSGVNISSEVCIEKHVKVNCNANIMHNSCIGDFTTIAPNAVILGHVKIGKRCYIGANSTILPHVTICDDITVGAGSVVTKDIITPNTVFSGIPARQHKRQ